MARRTKEQREKDMKAVIADHEIEGFEFDDFELNVAQRIVSGEITHEEALQIFDQEFEEIEKNHPEWFKEKKNELQAKKTDIEIVVSAINSNKIEGHEFEDDEIEVLSKVAIGRLTDDQAREIFMAKIEEAKKMDGD